MPGFCRSGIQSSSTTALMSTVMRPKLEPGVDADALRQHVPGGDADLAAHDQRDADPVEEEAEEELREASREAPGHGCEGVVEEATLISNCTIGLLSK